VFARRVALGVLLAALALPAAAQGAFPGANGKIAFTASAGTSGSETVWTVDPDGSNLTKIADGRSPAWSPDGTRIAYIGSGGIHVANADGSGDVALGLSDSCFDAVSWSPDGTKLLFCRYEYPDSDLFTANVDGTGITRLAQAPTSAYEGRARWSPDGTRIAYTDESLLRIGLIGADGTGSVTLTPTAANWGADWSPDGSRISFISRREDPGGDVWTMKPDGTDLVKLTGYPGPDQVAAWSPDGQQIALWRLISGTSGIWTMNADGSGLHQITPWGTAKGLDWQPLPRRYVRPKGATPLRTPLVPAFRPCTGPNRTHGAPLSFPSCSPPGPSAATAYIGVGDGDPAPAKSIGSVVLKVLAGAPGAPDDSDVSVAASTTNVMNTSDHSDYAGELRLELPLRLTDRLNTPDPAGSGPGTLTDTSVFATIPCSATADTTVGATCSLTTTADTLVPGLAPEGARSIWQLDQLKVYDGGADGIATTTGDNELFQVEGLFVP
jgi:hypothetical protein